ncbi:unnamed protein product [Didymodactylos carnosus]|uniref:EF-hand domain-containing protein n=1 Tax=Didymodactylos carnosus TaxID=1234261 RepID=A0A8S2DJT0_9BILA|nr:unnamed protein product [Didymodactylos carnosus]CAF3757988.1 unnamed protein product [Didymodactylos carnosus]
MFSLSPYQVSQFRLCCLPVLVKTLNSMIKWPNQKEMVNLALFHPVLGRYLGAVDSTRHFIQRPTSYGGGYGVTGEFDAAAAAFSQADTNRDGTLDAGDFSQFAAGGL